MRRAREPLVVSRFWFGARIEKGTRVGLESGAATVGAEAKHAALELSSMRGTLADIHATDGIHERGVDHFGGAAATRARRRLLGLGHQAQPNHA